MVKLKKVEGLRKILREMHEIELSKNQIRELIEENYTCWARFLGFNDVLRQEITKARLGARKGNEAYNCINHELEDYSKNWIRSMNNPGY